MPAIVAELWVELPRKAEAPEVIPAVGLSPAEYTEVIARSARTPIPALNKRELVPTLRVGMPSQTLSVSDRCR
jgi:hypothetical protein